MYYLYIIEHFARYVQTAAVGAPEIRTFSRPTVDPEPLDQRAET